MQRRARGVVGGVGGRREREDLVGLDAGDWDDVVVTGLLRDWCGGAGAGGGLG